jgi:N-terminal domain of anti-restriction factor ArdC
MNTYEIVTERIINLLEHGVIPWRRPWAATGLPRNLVSKKTYRGVNSFLLGATKYVSPFWLTLKQANQLGGSVRKGEHGELVIFWKVEGLDETDRDTVNIEGNETARRRLLLRFYRSGTSNSAHCRKRCSTSYLRSRCTSTIRSKPPKRSSLECPIGPRFATKAQRLTTTLSPIRSPYPLANCSRVLNNFMGRWITNSSTRLALQSV